MRLGRLNATDSFHCATIIVAGAPLGSTPSSPLFRSVSPMATVVQGSSTREGAFYQDAQFEPDQAWKNDLRRLISQGLQPLVDEARQEHANHWIPKPSNDYEHASNENVKHTYEVTMTRIRRTAQEQYDAEIEHERQLRRLAAGVPLDEGWSETLVREQLSLWNAVRKAPKTQDRAPSRLAFGGSTNAAAGPSRIGLDGYVAGDGFSTAQYDTANTAYDNTARYSRWVRGTPSAQPQPEWPMRRDGTIQSVISPHAHLTTFRAGELPRGDADPLSVLERWVPRVDEPSGPAPSVPKNPSKLGRVHFPIGDPENGSQTPRRAGKQIAVAPEDDGPGPDDLRSFLANAELQLAMGDDAPRTPQIPVHFTHVPHLYDRAQSVTPKPTMRAAPRMASKLSNEVEASAAAQAPSAPQEVTRTDSYLFMQTTSRVSASTPHPAAASTVAGGVQVVDPRSFTVDDDARSFQSPYQAPFALPDFRPPPLGAGQASSLQSLWQSAGSRADLSQSEQKSPRSDEMVVVASDEGDSDWEASGFDKDELERMIQAEMSNVDSETSTVVPEPFQTAEEPAVEETSVPGAFAEEPEEPKAKAKGGKAKKKEEARRREEEAKRKAEEVKRREEEIRRKEEERRKAEETKHKEEEAKRKKEAEAAKSKPMTAQARRAAAAEEKKKAEAQRKLEAERRRLEEAKLAEEAQRAEEERLRVEEQKRRDAEALEQRLGRDKLAAFIKEQESRNKAEKLRNPEDKQRALEEERARQRELEKKRLEEEKRKQEEAALAERIGKEKLEAFMKQQEEARRRMEGRPRTDSVSRTPSAEHVKPSILSAKDQKDAPKKASEQQPRKRTVTFAEEDPKDREARLAAVEDMQRRREEDLRTREEELRRREEELRRRESEGEDRKRKPAAPQTKADELRVKERQLARQAEENQKKEQELRKREEALHRRAEDLLAKMKAQQEEFRRECMLMGMSLSK